MKRVLLSIVTVFMCSIAFAQSDSLFSLQDFRDIAIRQSNEIQISNEKIKIAEQMSKAAFAQYFPNISANAAYMYNQKDISLLHEDALLPVGVKMADGSFGFTPENINNEIKVINGQPVPLDKNGQPFDPKKEPGKIEWKNYAYLPKEAMEFDMQNVFAGGIGFIQPIFMGNKIRELNRIAKSNEEVEHLKHKDEIQNLIVEVDQAYWRVVSLMNKKKLAYQYKALLEKLNSDVDIMYKEGVATKGDLLNVRVKHNEASLACTKADNGVALSKMALFQLCGLDINGNYRLKDEDIEQEIIPNVNDINMETVFDNRVEIKQLDMLSKIAKSNANIKKGALMPNLAVSANYIVTNPNVYNGFSNKFSGMFNASVILNVPIFHFGAKSHIYRAAKYQQNIVQHKIEQAKELITLQVNQSKYRIEEANKKLETALSNIAAANENLKLANEAYNEGVASIIDLLQAQTAWVSANSERIDAGIEVRLCEVYLLKALGENNY